MKPSPSLSTPSWQPQASSCRSILPSWSLSTPSQHDPLTQAWAQSPPVHTDESAPSADTDVQVGTAARSDHWRANSPAIAVARPTFLTYSEFSSFSLSPDAVQFIEPKTTAAELGSPTSATAHLLCDLPPQFSVLTGMPAAHSCPCFE